MATVLSPPEQRTLLRDISWETYESLLAERLEKSNPRYTYDKGLLEIMSPSYKHEQAKDLTLLLVRLWGVAIKIKVRSFGSTTFHRKDLQVGFEPDCCFYIQSVEKLPLDTHADFAKDLPPDLIVEIDITNSSINKMPLFAAIGISEVWIYSNKVRIFKLDAGSYKEVGESPALPGLTTALITDLIEKGRAMDDDEWFRLIQERATQTK